MVDYLDANILIYAAVNDPTYGKPCMRILREVQQRKREVACSLLILVEFVHVMKKLARSSPMDIEQATDAILALPIQWLDLNVFLIKQAIGEPLSGMDSVHLATMESQNIKRIITADRDFDRHTQRIDPLRV